MLNRKIAPKIFEPIELHLKLKPYTTFTLDNGTRVYSINAGAQDVTMIECVFYAGNWYEEKNIVAASTNFLLKNGTKTKSAFAINEHFDFYGAYLNRSCQNETATLTLHSLSKHLHALLPQMAEIITESIFPENELAIYKQNQQQKLAVNLKKCDFIANRLIDEYLFGFHHPYGKYTSIADYEQLNREEIVQFYNTYYAKGKCFILTAGKLPSNIQELLNQSFGQLPINQSAIPEKQFTPSPATQKKYSIINDANGVQGAIRLARLFPNRHHPDYPKAQVLNNILGGFFGSRLMSNIREDKGYTYGIHSYLQSMVQQSAWMISTEAGRDVCQATIDEVYKEMERLCYEPIPEEELNLVRNYIMGSLLGDLDGPFQIISRWKNYFINGLDENYFYNTLNIIKNITPQELTGLAQQYLQPTDFYELLVI